MVITNELKQRVVFWFLSPYFTCRDRTEAKGRPGLEISGFF